MNLLGDMYVCVCMCACVYLCTIIVMSGGWVCKAAVVVGGCARQQ